MILETLDKLKMEVLMEISSLWGMIYGPNWYLKVDQGYCRHRSNLPRQLISWITLVQYRGFNLITYDHDDSCFTVPRIIWFRVRKYSLVSDTQFRCLVYLYFCF